MSSNLSITPFPLILPKGKNGTSNNGTSWQRTRSPIECINAKISNTPLDATTVSCIHREMSIASEHIPYKITGKLGSSTLIQKYMMCQFVKKFGCCYPGCEREYAVFQRDGWICIYTYESHIHEPCIFQHGISPDVKKIILDHKNCSRPVYEAIRHIRGLQCDLVRQPEFHRLLYGTSFNLSYQKKMYNVWNNGHGDGLLFDPKWFADTPQNGLHSGTNLEQTVKFIDELMITPEIFARTTKRELEMMSNEKLNELVVLATDIGDNSDHSYTYIVLANNFSLIVIDKAIERAKLSNEGIQFEADYAYDIMKYYQVGVFGCSDFAKRFHSCVWDVNITENSDGASRVMSILNNICKLRGQENVNKVMTDGAKALKKAASQTGLVHHSCFSHMIRCGMSKNGKGHGRLVANGISHICLYTNHYLKPSRPEQLTVALKVVCYVTSKEKDVAMTILKLLPLHFMLYDF